LFRLSAETKQIAHNKGLHPTAHALSVCVHARKLAFSHTNGQHMHCG